MVLKDLILEHTVESIMTGEKTLNSEACIIKKNGLDINLEMIKRGYAWAYRKHLRSPYASFYIGAKRHG